MMQELDRDKTADASESAQPAHIHELRIPNERTRLGFRVGGHFAGPNALVSGHAELTRPVFQRLLLIPTLGWLRGNLFLITLEQLDHLSSVGNLSEILGANGPMDGQISLPSLNMGKFSAPEQEELVRRGCVSALQLCARLGMIRGRGITSAGDAGLAD